MTDKPEQPHTPTPWFVDAIEPTFVFARNGGKTEAHIADCDFHNGPATMGGDFAVDVANAQHIVKCVNGWDAQAARIAELEKVVGGIAKANRFDRSIFPDDTEFISWAQSLCRGALTRTA